ncbi:MAG: hypothetical protein AAB325_13305, partial [Pseudomonadota bacterium]
MKIVPANVNRTVVTRVIVAWAALSLLAGTVVFYVELGRVSRMVFGLTTKETQRFTEHIEAIGPEHVEVLKTQAEEFLRGDFISVRLYGVNKIKILETFDRVGDAARPILPAHVHDLAPGELDHHHMSWVDGRLLMQVLLPVAGSDGV